MNMTEALLRAKANAASAWRANGDPAKPDFDTLWRQIEVDVLADLYQLRKKAGTTAASLSDLPTSADRSKYIAEHGAEAFKRLVDLDQRERNIR